MSHDVFISYASTDQNAALAVLHGLEAAGVRCWMAPRDIKPGDNWAQAIMDGIDGCHIMVVVFSARANKSSHVLNEVDAAVRKGAIVIPVRIENVMPDGAMEYHLRTRHWLDALTPDLAAHAKVLAEQVKVILAGGTIGQSFTPPPREMPKDLPPRKVKTPKPARSWARARRTLTMWLILLLALAGTGWWFFLREHPVSGVQFTVKEVSSSGGNALSFRMKSLPLRFFEGPNQPQGTSQRRYNATFAAGAIRYLYPEVGLAYDRPGKDLRVPITCAVVRDGGQIITNISIIAKISANWDTSAHTEGWGSDRGGNWDTGRYRFDCRYGDKLIARDWVTIVGGGIITQIPPPPPDPGNPQANTNPNQVVSPNAMTGSAPSPLLGIRGRISNLRLFATGATLPPAEARQEVRDFPVNATSFIGIQVTLSHTAPGQVVNTQVLCRFFDGQKQLLGSILLKYQIQPDWTTSVNAGIVGHAGQTWGPGRYDVACEDETGRPLANTSFRVR